MLFLLLHQNRSLMSVTAFGSWTLLSDFILLLHQKCQIAMVGMNEMPLFRCRISYDNGEYFSKASVKLYHNFFAPLPLYLFMNSHHLETNHSVYFSIWISTSLNNTLIYSKPLSSKILWCFAMIWQYGHNWININVLLLPLPLPLLLGHVRFIK